MLLGHALITFAERTFPLTQLSTPPDEGFDFLLHSSSPTSKVNFLDIAWRYGRGRFPSSIIPKILVFQAGEPGQGEVDDGACGIRELQRVVFSPRPDKNPKLTSARSVWGPATPLGYACAFQIHFQ